MRWEFITRDGNPVIRIKCKLMSKLTAVSFILTTTCFKNVIRDPTHNSN